MNAFALLAVAAAIVFHAYRSKPMSDLTQAVDDLIAEVTDSTTKLDSIETFIKGVPDLVATAVAEALANANVEETAAAAAVQSAKQAISDKVDEALAAVPANTTV